MYKCGHVFALKLSTEDLKITRKFKFNFSKVKSVYCMLIFRTGMLYADCEGKVLPKLHVRLSLGNFVSVHLSRSSRPIETSGEVQVTSLHFTTTVLYYT